KEIFLRKEMFFFLIAYFFYIDGVNTIIYMSTAYGTTLQIDSTQMMLALLMVQILAFPFALLYGELAKRYSAKLMLAIGIGVYMGICILGFNVTKNFHFWLLAALVATSQGGIQALSRSIFGKMIPDVSRSNEFFGFFEIFGKFSAIMGPWLFGFVGLQAAKIISKNNPGMALAAIDKASSPYGVISVLGIFIIGAVFYGLYWRTSKKSNQ
ncbi:MAG: MFS transporter, partial [Spirochaetales bacterium]|nr:MFS transporter [Spirochaetales bacterium]